MEEILKAIGLNNGILGTLAAGAISVAGYFYVDGKSSSKAHAKELAELNKERREEMNGVVAALNSSTRALDANERVFSQVTSLITETSKGFTALASRIDEREARAHDDFQRIERGQESLSRDIDAVLRRSPT